MTSLDDALASSSVEFGPHQLKTYWRESDGSSDGSINADTPTDMTSQVGAMTITHNLDDGLPDPVTMTTSADAAGVMSADLTGREGLTLASSGARTADYVSGAAQTSITPVIPAGTIRDDFILAVVLIDDDTANLVQTVNDPKDSWDFLGMVTDSPLAMYVYCKRRWRTGNPALSLIADKPVDYMVVSQAFWGRNPTNMALDYRVTGIQLLSEASSTTTHVVSSTLLGRGYQWAAWGSASIGTITPVSPMVLAANPALNGLVVTSAIRPFAESGVYTASATQSPANAVMCMAAVSLEPYARPRMTARKYFSPFNKDSPVYGWDRDTATVMASIRTITSTGPVDTLMFSGQMQGIPLTEQGATLQAVSRTRIRLNKNVVLPVVNGNREGLTTDWLITWLAAQGSQFVGPAPTRYTRFWAPLHGSMHSHWSQPGEYNAVFQFKPPGPPGGPFGVKNPATVDGPFVTGMFAEQTLTNTQRINMRWSGPDFDGSPNNPFPHIAEAGGPFMMDMLSQGNSKGRLCFRIRADAVASAPSYLDSGEDYIMFFLLFLSDQYGTRLGSVKFGIDSATRTPYVQMGSLVPGTGTVTYAASGVLPTDGAWHFFGVYWDFAAGTARVQHNGTESSSSFWAGTYNVTTQLPLTDKQGRDQGHIMSIDYYSHLPMSEVMIDAGEPYAAGFWDDQWPTPQAPGGTFTFRATNTRLAGLAFNEVVNAWELLAELARNNMAMYRVDEADNLNILPPSYFGETAQTTVSAIQDTTTNTGDLMPVVDPSKSRNVVTVQYPETRIDSRIQPMLQYNSSVPIPPGTSFITFPLEVPCVEVHGNSAGNLLLSSTYAINNLTAVQIANPSTIPVDHHYITVAGASDGTGGVYSEVQVFGRFVDSDGVSVTIKFVNGTGATAWLANNGDQVPFLYVLGYGLRSDDAYTTIRDTDSVRLRGERGLDAQMNWVHDRATASALASSLLSVVGQPRPELTMRVVGDPRRKPGQLATVVDSEDIMASGNWRILSVAHNADGPQYTQDLLLVQVLPVAVWDGLDGWDSAVWS